MTRKNTGLRLVFKSVLMWGAMATLAAALFGPKMAADRDRFSLTLPDFPVAAVDADDRLPLD